MSASQGETALQLPLRYHGRVQGPQGPVYSFGELFRLHAQSNM